MKSTNFFSPDNPLYKEPDQVKRQKNALKLNVQSVDQASQSGKINDYTVTLQECSCRDFSMHHKPCKHMYRLAHELGIFQLAGKTVNDSTVKNKRQIKDEKDALKALISSLSKPAQMVLQEVVSLSKHYFDSSLQESIHELIDAKLVTIHPMTLTDIFASYTIADMLELCVDAKPAKATRRTTVIAFFAENYPDKASEMLRTANETTISIELSDTVEEKITLVQRFLARKLGRIYQDLENNIIRELPE